VSDKG
jgi:hypothetical protein